MYYWIYICKCVEKVTTYYDVSSSLYSDICTWQYSCFTENPEHPLYITYLRICKNWNTSSQQNICIIENAGFRVAEFIYACVVEQEHIDVQIKEVQWGWSSSLGIVLEMISEFYNLIPYYWLY